jgi:hypothetical protein
MRYKIKVNHEIKSLFTMRNYFVKNIQFCIVKKLVKI